MPSDRTRTHGQKKVGSVLTMALVATAMTACVHQPSPRPGSTPRTATHTSRPEPAPTRDPAMRLLDYAHRLHAATPEQRADAVEKARQDASDAPAAETYARLALAYGTPSQRRYTPDEAARYAQRALDADDAHWSPAARQYLSDYARLYGEITTPPGGAAPGRSSNTDGDAASKQVDADPDAAEQARIERLQTELYEAQRKLRELANIEDRLGDAQP